MWHAPTSYPAGVNAPTGQVVKQGWAQVSQGRIAGAQLLCFDDADYPQALRDLPDAPPVLWAQGNVALLNRPMVAMVGARNASSLGLRMARRVARSTIRILR